MSVFPLEWRRPLLCPALNLTLWTLCAVAGFAASLRAQNASPSSLETDLTSSESSAGSRDRIGELRRQIAHHNILYFEKAAPEISDAQYDELKRELVRLEAALPRATRELAPPSDLGDDRTPGFARYRHGEPMLSLEKCYSEAELRVFLRRLRERLGEAALEFVVEPKFDGVAISITYEKGELVRATTRGDGHEGDDVTANVLALPALPRRLRTFAPDGSRNPIPDTIELRGEIYLRNADFERINREQEAAGEPLFSHPRTLAAGTLKQHDPTEIAARGLQVVFYAWGAHQPANAVPDSQRAFHALVRAWGLPGVDLLKTAGTDREVWAAVREIGAARKVLAYPTDGAVVKLNSTAQQRELGSSDTAPRWAIAYKFPPERAATTLLGITLQVGRSGALTPVAALTPVRLGGTTIARASLYNRAEIIRRDLRIGDTVMLEKAGEIIPAVIGFDPARRPPGSVPFAFPTTCPSCGQPIFWENGDAILRCSNEDCPAQMQRRLEHFASKAALAIEGLGPATIEILVANGAVKNAADFYRLDRARLESFGQKTGLSATRLLAAVESSKHAELWRLIHGLGIPEIGATAAHELAERCGSLEALATATPEMWAGSRDGKRTAITSAGASALAHYFGDSRHRVLIADLISLGVKPAAPPAPAAGGGGALHGKLLVLTGIFPSLPREVAIARIEKAGGRVAGTVSRRTDFVVAGKDPGTKLREAASLGIPIIDETELLQMMARETSAP